MTDEQWLWLLVNQSIDTDEELEGMCDDCRNEVTSKNRCSRCGKELIPTADGGESCINTGFDMEKYERMKNTPLTVLKKNTNDIHEEDTNVDIDLAKQILDLGD